MGPFLLSFVYKYHAFFHFLLEAYIKKQSLIRGGYYMPTMVDSSVQHMQKCIDACNKCMQACEECLNCADQCAQECRNMAGM